ncbi:MAG: hypothetical protein ACPKPY_14220 [Nitrososphaeraceae archaeon]
MANNHNKYIVSNIRHVENAKNRKDRKFFEYKKDNNNNELFKYYLFSDGKIRCEAMNCNTISTEKLNLSIVDHGEHIFYFCRECVQKFIGDNKIE